MTIQKNKSNELEVKTKNTIILIDGMFKVNDLELEGAGEYEVGGVSIQGIDDNIYIFLIEDVSVGFVNFKAKISKENGEKLSSADVLIVRLDGEVGHAVEQVGQIEPKIVVYAGDEKAKDQLKKSGVTPKEEEIIKLTKAETDTKEEAYFVEISHERA